MTMKMKMRFATCWFYFSLHFCFLYAFLFLFLLFIFAESHSMILLFVLYCSLTYMPWPCGASHSHYTSTATMITAPNHFALFIAVKDTNILTLSTSIFRMSLQTMTKRTRMVTSQTRCRVPYTKSPQCCRAIRTALLSYISIPFNYLMQYHWKTFMTSTHLNFLFGVSTRSSFFPAKSRTWTEISSRNSTDEPQEEPFFMTSIKWKIKWKVSQLL